MHRQTPELLLKPVLVAGQCGAGPEISQKQKRQKT